ncbi:MAG: DUF975 family protein [Clostridiales bacterium]|nr:DUF975 family protein [Clostridiales bacterium]
MWDRKELKAKGKAAYKANRVTCIIASFLLLIATGAAGGGASAGSNLDSVPESNQSIDSTLDSTLNGSFDGSFLTPAVITLIIVVVFIAIAIGVSLGIFLLNPLQVGLQKFFVDNATDHTTGLNRGNIGVAFNEHYMKVVGSMFTTGLFTALWCLLLLFPGIYKAYCWRLVPYIISENPDITGAEARERSAMMMNGSKWDSFVMDLSFLGWKILGAFTLGILNLVFTNPYQDATNAELYLTLSGRPSEIAAPAEIVEEAAPEVEFEFDQEGMND